VGAIFWGDQRGLLITFLS